MTTTTKKQTKKTIMQLKTFGDLTKTYPNVRVTHLALHLKMLFVGKHVELFPIKIKKNKLKEF